MTTATTGRRRWIGEVAVGVYAGLGAVALAVYLYESTALSPRWLPFRGVPTAFNGFLWSLESVALPLATAASALVAWLWLSAVRQATMPARVAAAATLAVAGVCGAAYATGSSVPPLSLLAQPRMQFLFAVLLGVAALQWLPVPRAWRRPMRRRGVLVLLLALPLVPLVLQAENQLSLRLSELRSSRRLAVLSFPLPPGAADVRDECRRGVRVIRFVVRETYPSTAVADFYARVLADQGWSAGGPGAPAGVPRSWDESAGYYVARKRHAGTSYRIAWTGRDGSLSCLLRLSYVAPASAAPDLPVKHWPQEWLEVQQVRVILASHDLPRQ